LNEQRTRTFHYHSTNVYAEANANRTFALGSLMRRYIKNNSCAMWTCMCYSLLFTAVRYQNHHILDYRNHNLSRKSFFQVLI